LADHLVPDGLAVLIADAFRCPRQHVADFVPQVGHDFSGEGFPEFQFFGLVILGDHRGASDAQAGVLRMNASERTYISSERSGFSPPSLPDGDEDDRIRHQHLRIDGLAVAVEGWVIA